MYELYFFQRLENFFSIRRRKFCDNRSSNDFPQKFRGFLFSNLELFPKLCKQLIELILNINVTKISYPEREKVIENRTDSKGIRLDVYVHDNQNRSFDLEMQIADVDNIAKRMRYYQGLIDGNKLKHGQHYSELGESYIIFICPFDKFNQGRHIYTFRERCDQDFNLPLNDGAVKIFLNTKGILNDVSDEIKNFLNYVDSGIVADFFTKQIDDAVRTVKTNRKARKDFMTYQMALLESELEGEERGRKKGRIEERDSIALNMLRKGLEFEMIHELTKLSIEKIQELAKNKID